LADVVQSGWLGWLACWSVAIYVFIGSAQLTIRYSVIHHSIFNPAKSARKSFQRCRAWLFEGMWAFKNPGRNWRSTVSSKLIFELGRFKRCHIHCAAPRALWHAFCVWHVILGLMRLIRTLPMLATKRTMPSRPNYSSQRNE
jgi:hypothetical protein